MRLCATEFAPTEPSGTARWWREWEFWALAALTCLIYFSRIADLPLRGEETRRAMVAQEILETGDWIVARQQREPFLSRPPVGSWPIAWLSQVTGELSPAVVRLPTVFSTLLTALLVYVYSHRFLSRLGALAAGLAFISGAQVLQLGRVAETEALFTLLFAAAMLVWHAGYTRLRLAEALHLRPFTPSSVLAATQKNFWPAARVWCAAYALLAAATLVKSLQAPVYFGGTVALYLLWRRDWRFLLGPAHFVGLAVFAALFAAWQWPFYQALGWDAVRKVWASDVGLRFEEISTGIVLRHLASFPLQVWACLLPWSLLLPAYAWPQFRRTIGPAMPLVVFCALAWLVALPTCWFVPNARPRYIMPLYPLAAPLMGLVVQRLYEASASAILRRGWLWFLGSAAFGMCGAAIAVGVASYLPNEKLTVLRQPMWLAATYLAAATAAVAVIVRGWNLWSPRAATGMVLTIGGFLGLTFAGLAVNTMIALDPGTRQQIAQLRQRIPADEQLASFGLVETMFTYHWRKPVVVAMPKLPTSSEEVPTELDYFCFHRGGQETVELPFPWRVEAIISVDRVASDCPEKVVVVGRRVAKVATLDRTPNVKRR